MPLAHRVELVLTDDYICPCDVGKIMLIVTASDKDLIRVVAKRRKHIPLEGDHPVPLPHMLFQIKTEMCTQP